MGYTKMTAAQALVRFLDNQYVEQDGQVTKFVEGVFTIFGHGIVVGLGQALEENPGDLKVYQGRNEQGMAHAATGFAKQSNRKKIIACASSIGPGAANMVTAAACATVNHIPLLLLPGDTFASRQPDPVLQQLEQSFSPAITTNDAFRPVCKFWDRIVRPEQLMTTMVNAMRVLTDPAETGAVCVALSQDVQGESYDYPDYFFEKRVHRISRPLPCERDLEELADWIIKSRKPMVICGGGVRYSEAGKALEEFCERFHIPFAETQAGKSACHSSNPFNLGGLGVTGNLSANTIAEEADLILAVGTRLSDFTTGSKGQFRNPEVRIASINISRYDAYKMDALPVVADARAAIEALTPILSKKGYASGYTGEIEAAKRAWEQEMERLSSYIYDDDFRPLIQAGNPVTVKEFAELTQTSITQTAAISLIRKEMEQDAIVVGASGSLPGCLQRMWTTDKKDSYHMEYGYSCMGYEISASLGVKMAAPQQEVYSMCGDGSFQMLHSELITSLQEGVKINVLLFDNCGFGCINNLQMSNGIGNLATEFRYRSQDGQLNGGLIPIDYAKVCEGYGVKTYTAKTLEELSAALAEARKQTVSTLIDIKVLPKTMTDGYRSWWNVGLASVTGVESQQKAYESLIINRTKARRY
ncbi:3D-(3,5/4)-trihydroxycyclohexane-1,2-dione acylhydrolase (decyclizing) [Clostridium sp. HBUAS56010]|uniref:3D-(3,5/4)-trihydroxycyclohexane-1,2-dione acylhydrolase (decyclizing) n=1 Tax=Clostridium sp. HBUAS56010 TaxID=2571127 RepID=UPI0011785DC3|nr:3D-(3,5/4)-trihydroxycyclohexane-1,2-dione acylhydrolase (decyclizing) [Clostridium sp. HBUAS56010]